MSQADPYVILAEDLWKVYQLGEQAVEALRGVSLTVARNEFLAIMGPSGSGKSTLMNLIGCLDTPSSGTYRLNGKLVSTMSEDELAFIRNREIGFVFQVFNLLPKASAFKNVELPLIYAGVKKGEREDKARRALERVEMKARMTHKPAELSGGERQRVAIARALVCSPRLLLMDEPLSALDREAKAGLMPYLERLHETLAIPVLYVSHALDEVTRLADHLLVLRAGAVQMHGPIADMLVNLEFSITGTEEAGAVIDAVVVGHEDSYDLTALEFNGGRLLVARRIYPLGRRARLHIQARDVSIALSRAADTSILNILPARVAQVADAGPAQWLVRLEVGDAPAPTSLLSRITRRSGEALGLRPGMPVYAQVKSVALLD
jgi:molybdate transport system ATP-binding protein